MTHTVSSLPTMFDSRDNFEINQPYITFHSVGTVAPESPNDSKAKWSDQHFCQVVGINLVIPDQPGVTGYDTNEVRMMLRSALIAANIPLGHPQRNFMLNADVIVDAITATVKHPVDTELKTFWIVQWQQIN